MSDKTESKTEKESSVVETLFGLKPHYKTTISDGSAKSTGIGLTSESSQKVASAKWKGGEVTSKGGCYLTSACVQARGYADDCLELTVLRRFRDGVLSMQPSGAKAIREYYSVAPDIVDAIMARPDQQTIWKEVYRDISHAVSLVIARDFNGAFRHYSAMEEKLRQGYL